MNTTNKVKSSFQSKAAGPGDPTKVCRLLLRKMPRKFVAESIGVSRQAVSKWELGGSDPITANLFAPAKLFGIPPEELLQGVE